MRDGPAMRFAVLYVVMIGTPLLVLLLVLRLGADLQPPRAVGGTWELAPPGRAALEVAQSGPVLELRWGETTGRGRLEGDEVSGQVGPWALRARLDDQGRLVGTLGEAELVAARAPARRREGGH
ncbi:MAG: hypothetical protein KF878_19715 [Planctomycetes bacterium]|nr:hypothetical protein [Planctomycetota bacterium]